MTREQHATAAEDLLGQADKWMNADYGWKGTLSSEQRLAYRMADLAAAQVHATLATVPRDGWGNA